MKKNRILITSIFLLLQINIIFAADLQECKQFYVNVLEDSALNTWQKKITEWETKKIDCVSSGSYEYYLADAHERAGNLNKARNILLEAISAGNQKYRKWLLLELVSIEYKLHYLHAGISHSNVMIKEFPFWAAGYSFKGNFELDLKNYQSAIENFKKSNSLEPGYAADEGLILAYYSLDKYRESYAAFHRAASADKTILDKKDFILCAVYSAFYLKRYDEAQDLLNKIKQNVPGIVNDIDYQKATNILNSLKK